MIIRYCYNNFKRGMQNQNICKQEDLYSQHILFYNTTTLRLPNGVDPVPSKLDDNTQMVADLQESQYRFLQFVRMVEKMPRKEIRQDVLEHCDQFTKIFKQQFTSMDNDDVMALVQSRTQKMIKNRRWKKNWGADDVKILVWTISKYSDLNNILNIDQEFNDQHWQSIAKLIPGSTAKSCLFKWLGLKKMRITTYSWHPSQVQQLKRIVEQIFGDETIDANEIKWRTVSQQLFTRSNRPQKIFRNAKQCKQQWVCYLKPNLRKGPWEAEQDIKLLKMIKAHGGEKKWSTIVLQFQGRTQNSLKNRYNLLIDKMFRKTRNKDQLKLVEDLLEKVYSKSQIKIQSRSGDEILHESKLEQLHEQKQKQKNINSNNIVQEVSASPPPPPYSSPPPPPYPSPSAGYRQTINNRPCQPYMIKIEQAGDLKVRYIRMDKKQQFMQILRYNHLKQCCIPIDAITPQ